MKSANESKANPKPIKRLTRKDAVFVVLAANYIIFSILVQNFKRSFRFLYSTAQHKSPGGKQKGMLPCLGQSRAFKGVARTSRQSIECVLSQPAQ